MIDAFGHIRIRAMEGRAVRRNEPPCKDTLDLGRIVLGGLRSGTQWHGKTALEARMPTWTSL